MSPFSRRLWKWSVALVVFGGTGVALWYSVLRGPKAVEPGFGPRGVLSFNLDWRFIKDDPPGASRPDFDDSAWKVVSAPHTYNDTDTFDDWSLPGHRGEQLQWAGRTWYRKSFVAPPAWRGKRVIIEFEAVRQVAEVYLNGALLGTAKSGFTPFAFDLTPQMRWDDSPNVLALMCDNRFMKDPVDPAYLAAISTSSTGGAPLPDQNMLLRAYEVNHEVPEDLEDLEADQIPWNNPRWHPAHGGIYRNVRLHVLDPLHVTLPLYSFLETEGPYAYVRWNPEGAAQVCVDVPIHNGRSTRRSVRLAVAVRDPAGRCVLNLSRKIELEAGTNTVAGLSGVVENPLCWDPAAPNIYRVAISLETQGQIVDNCEIPLGIRAARWDRGAGLQLNGRALKLRGWGQRTTDEWPGLGTAQPDWMHSYTLSLMKEAGGNFVRWGHCAAGPASINAGDMLGLVALQPGVDGSYDTVRAAWALRTAAFRDTIVYFRNNPSILLWEGGNWRVSREHARELRAIVDRYDPNGGRVLAFRRAVPLMREFMDIDLSTEGQAELHELPVVEAEYNREESPRRVWDKQSPPSFGSREAQMQPYRLTSEEYAVNQVAQYIKKVGAASCGGANWIFSDSTSGGRVGTEVARASGEVDGVRLPKEAYHVCRAMFSETPQVHIIGHWTYPAGTKKTVYVASNGDAVELLVNGRSLGLGRLSERYLFVFDDVAFEEGVVEAVARREGAEVARCRKQTAGAPYRLRLTPILGAGGLRADGSDVALFDVEAVDRRGNRCPLSGDRVDFEVNGPAVWRGGYNSGKRNSVNNLFLSLEGGVNRVAIRATREPGRIVVRALAPHLVPGEIAVEAHAVAPESGGGLSDPDAPGSIQASR